MPRALSAGLWRPVSLVYKPVERFETLYLETLSANENAARVVLHYGLKIEDPIADNYEIEVEGRCGDSTFSRRQKMTFGAGKLPSLGSPTLLIENPRLWWPHGWGEANLYDVTGAPLEKRGRDRQRAISSRRSHR
jgi:beta-mannosidase